MSLAPAELEELLALVAATEPEEIDCDQMLTRMASWLEAVDAAGQVPLDTPLLRSAAQHLRVCGECREEAELLLRICREGEGDAAPTPPVPLAP